MICRKPTVLSMQKLIANRWVEDWEASNGHTKDTTRLFHGPWHVSVGEHICGGPNLNGWWVIARTSSKWGKFWLGSWIWPWRSRSTTPQNNRDLNQGLLHPWSKFGDPSLNGWWVIARTNLVTDGLANGRTDGRRQRQYPKANTGNPNASKNFILKRGSKWLRATYLR